MAKGDKMKKETIEMINDILKAQEGSSPATFQVKDDGQIIIINMAPKHLTKLIKMGYSVDIGQNGSYLYKF